MALELILEFDAKGCRPLREQVLRPGQPAEAWTYAEDDDPRSLHLALKDGPSVVAVASVLPQRAERGPEAWRLRGMAVAPDRQGTGLGARLLRALLAVVEQRGGGLWCQAREPAVAFYEAHGFRSQGATFDVPGAGPHRLLSWHPPGRRLPAPP